MDGFKGITVCVQYDDLLAVALPWNLHHFKEVVVVTSPADTATQELCRELNEQYAGNKIKLHVTDAFYRNGAKFNKGLAVEEGLDVLGRDGWMLIWDADTLFPITMRMPRQIGKLYTPHRYILEDVQKWRTDLDWTKLPMRVEQEWPGYFQLFHADDPVLQTRPWYGIDYKHAGGCDSVFQNKWHGSNRLRPEFNVLHLGPHGTNWYGRTSDRLDGIAIPEAGERRRYMQDMYEQRKSVHRRGGHQNERIR